MQALEEDMEGMCHMITKYQHAVSNEAATSKERGRHRTKMAELDGEIQKAVVAFNELQLSSKAPIRHG